METIVDKTYFGRVDTYEVVDRWPCGGYVVWNIGRSNFRHPGFIPLAKEGPDKYHVQSDSLKALRINDENLCLLVLREASIHGVNEERFNEIKRKYEGKI